jgi:hypothetical protein
MGIIIVRTDMWNCDRPKLCHGPWAVFHSQFCVVDTLLSPDALFIQNKLMFAVDSRHISVSERRYIYSFGACLSVLRSHLQANTSVLKVVCCIVCWSLGFQVCHTVCSLAYSALGKERIDILLTIPCRSRVRFPMVSLKCFIDVRPAALWPWGRLSL